MDAKYDFHGLIRTREETTAQWKSHFPGHSDLCYLSVPLARRDPECRIHLPNSRRRFHRAKACCIHRADRIVISSYGFSPKGKTAVCSSSTGVATPVPFTEAATEMRCWQMEGKATGNAGRPPEVTGDPLRGFSRGTHTSPMRSLACREFFSGSQRTVRRAHRN